MIRLTVTNLESFRRYREHEELTLAQLLREIRKERPQTPAMRAGEVLHSILEKPPADAEWLEVIERDGYRFRFDIDGEIVLKPFRELFGKRIYYIGRTEVELRGKADSIDGVGIDDHKLSKSFDAQRYHDSCQWRAYLSIFGADRFTYNVFVGGEEGRAEDGPVEWLIDEFHQVTFYRYPELEAEIIRELEQYVDFARRHLEAAA